MFYYIFLQKNVLLYMTFSLFSRETFYFYVGVYLSDSYTIIV